MSLPSRVDMVVIGAGPAGLATSILCANAGLHVLVLERNEAPRVVAAESLHPGCEWLMDQLGAGDAFRQAGFSRFPGIRVLGTLKQFGQDEQGPWLGFHIARDRFERLLEHQATARGVVVRRGVNVRGLWQEAGRVVGVRTAEGIVAARWVIDAGGRRHGSQRWLGLRRHVCSAPLMAFRGEYAGALHDEDGAARFELHGAGWCWTAQIDEKTSTWTILWPRGTPLPSPPDALSAFAVSLPRRGVDVTWRVLRPVAKPGCLLVGDAAAVVDPASGQGVLFALHSALMASRLIIECLADPRLEPLQLALYDDWVMRQFEHKVEGLRAIYESMGLTSA